MSPRKLPIAQEKNNLSMVLTKMSLGYPGGVEVSIADQYSQDLGQNRPSPLIYQSEIFSAKCHTIHIDNFCINEMYHHN
jgi:hypothetical protein